MKEECEIEMEVTQVSDVDIDSENIDSFYVSEQWKRFERNKIFKILLSYLLTFWGGLFLGIVLEKYLF